MTCARRIRRRGRRAGRACARRRGRRDVCPDRLSGVEPERPVWESPVGDVDGRAGVADPERPFAPEGVTRVLESLGLGPGGAEGSGPREGACGCPCCAVSSERGPTDAAAGCPVCSGRWDAAPAGPARSGDRGAPDPRDGVAAVSRAEALASGARAEDDCTGSPPDGIVATPGRASPSGAAGLGSVDGPPAAPGRAAVVGLPMLLTNLRLRRRRTAAPLRCAQARGPWPSTAAPRRGARRASSDRSRGLGRDRRRTGSRRAACATR